MWQIESAIDGDSFKVIKEEMYAIERNTLFRHSINTLCCSMYVLFLLCRSVYCLCVNVPPGVNPIADDKYIIHIHIYIYIYIYCS